MCTARLLFSSLPVPTTTTIAYNKRPRAGNGVIRYFAIPKLQHHRQTTAGGGQGGKNSFRLTNTLQTPRTATTKRRDHSLPVIGQSAGMMKIRQK